MHSIIKMLIFVTFLLNGSEGRTAPVTAPNSITGSTMATSSGTITAHQAVSAAAFTRSLGVVSHIDSGSAQWTNSTVLLNELSDLGISTLRDGAPFDYSLPTFITLAQAGVHFDILEANVYSFDQYGQVNAALDVSRAHQLEAAVPGSIIAFEGTNEYTTNAYWLNGQLSAGNLAWGLSDAAALHDAVRADGLFSSTPIIAPSAIQLDSLPNFSSYATASNVHIYGGVGQQLQDLIINSVNFAKASVPGGPVYITETGISSAGYGAANWGVTDEHTQAIIDLNAVLDGFSAGASMTFLYELMDEPNANGAVEQAFGLFHADGTPKPAATAIGNLTHLLADDGTGTVLPGSLNYALSGLPTGASSMLLEKSDGTFELILWDGRATLYDGNGPVTPPSSTVMVTLGDVASAIQVYDPVSGMDAIQSLANSNSVSVQLSADPIVLQLSFDSASPPAAPSTTNVVLGTGTSATISGTGQASSNVQVYEGTKLLGMTSVDANGNWSLKFNGTSSAQHSLTVTETTAEGTQVAAPGVTLYGTTKQILVGGAGDDFLIGASGDRLTGGLGDDHFIINKGSGKEAISDFDPFGDQISVDHHLVTSFADIMAHATQSGTSVLLSFSKADVVTIEHTQLSDLHASDFLIF